MENRFWWEQRKGERKIHWLNKKNLVKPKRKGGMGFHDLQLFNKALLAKQGWQLLQNPNSLMHQFLMSKYFPRTSFLETSVVGNVSFSMKEYL
jgi:hypothetical protein